MSAQSSNSMVRYLKQTKLFLVNYNSRKKLLNHDFSIVSNNCWGGQVYQNLGKSYNTPFIGLFFYGPCYIKLLENLDFYLKEDLKFIKESKYSGTKLYPIGVLHDIEVHFMHYATENDAYEKWNRRMERFNWNNIFVKLCDRDLVTMEHAERFDQLPYNKVFFSAKQSPSIKSLVWFKEFENSSSVDNELVAYKKYFDVVKWLNTGGTPK